MSEEKFSHSDRREALTSLRFFFSLSLCRDEGLSVNGSVVRLLPSPLPSLPPPVKPSEDGGADRLAGYEEGARGEEGEFDLFFKSGTK